MIQSIIPALLLFLFTSYSGTSGNLRIVSVDPSPEADNVDITIQYPEENELKQSLPIHVQVRVDGFPLGIETETPRRKEIRASDKGQTIRIVVDDMPYILLNEDDAPSDAFDNHDVYFRQSVETKIKQSLKQGDHLIRAYPAYSYGEAVRGDNTFNASVFSFKKQGIATIDLNAPMITYNEPQGNFSASQPILLDFLCHNCELSDDGFKVRLSIDGKVVKTLISANPYYIYGMSRGSHIIKLELLDKKNKLVNNSFATATRTISIR